MDGLVQERRNSSALAMELHLFSTNPITYPCIWQFSLTILIAIHRFMAESLTGIVALVWDH